MGGPFSQELRVAINGARELTINRYVAPTLQLCAMMNATCVMKRIQTPTNVLNEHTDVLNELKAGNFDLGLPWSIMLEHRLRLCHFSHPLFENQPGIFISKPLFQFCFNPLDMFEPLTWALLAATVLTLVGGNLIWRHCLTRYGSLKNPAMHVLINRQRQFRCLMLWTLVALVGSQLNAKAKSLLAIRCSERQFVDVPSIISSIATGELTHFVNAKDWNPMDFLVGEVHQNQKHLLSRAYEMNPPQKIAGTHEMLQAFISNSESPRRAFERNRIFIMLSLNSARHAVRTEPRLLRYASFVPIDTKQWLAFPIARNASWRFVKKVNVAVIRMLEVGFLEKYDKRYAMFEEKSSAQEIEVKTAVAPLKAGQYTLLFHALAVGILSCGVTLAVELFCKVVMKRLQMYSSSS